MKHAKFTLIVQLTETLNVSKDTLRLRLKRRDDFQIITLEILAPKVLNQELNSLKFNNCIFSSFNSHILQLERKRHHYNVSPNIWRQIKISVTTYVFQMRINFYENGHRRNWLRNQSCLFRAILFIQFTLKFFYIIH